MAHDDPDPIDAAHSHPVALSTVRIGDAQYDVVELRALHEADIHRATSFVTNFGEWTLPDPIGSALGSPRARLEWIHHTGELVLLGGAPSVGEAAIDVPATEGIEDGLPGFLGGAAVIGRSTTPGAVREYFAEEQVPSDTRAVVLGRIAHGPQVHELLWGWHLHHRDNDGWDWLTDRLAHL